MIINKLLLKLFGICFFVSTAIQKSNYNYLGCFLGDNLLSLGDERHNSSFISPKFCSELCSKKNYTFFFLKNDTCYCNKNYISILMKQFDSDCMIPCLGDNSSSCGSLNSVSSYITDSLKLDDFKKHGGYPIPIYVGCYAENISNGKNRLLKGIHRKSSTNTPQKCSEICFNMGYLYFGVTEGSGCLCGNQQPSKSSKIDDTNCNQPCSGDNNQFCGGEWKILGIYSTGITDHVPRKYVGCLDDDENKSEDKYLSYEMGNNNSPRRCMNLCNTRRFKYAAIKSNVCECRNYEPKFSLKRRDHDCITVCKENPSERCGGGTLVVSIYRTLYPEPRKNIVVNHIGCFNNLNMYPVLNGWKIMMSQLTSKRCVHNCFARMFPYAALISAHECLCSYIKPFNGAKTDGNNICTIPCSGSSEQSCGGDNAINVYSTGLELNTDAIGNYYLGCYENSRNKRVFNGSIQYFSANTPEFCSNYCYKNGYPYSGVSQKSECYCGFYGPDSARFPRLEDEQCNAICSGDVNQLCGGTSKMAIFSSGLEEGNLYKH